jgi:hypothetical protein
MSLCSLWMSRGSSDVVRSVVVIAAAILAVGAARAVERTEVVEREIALAAGVREVVIDNVFGPVEVKTGAAGKVTLELRQHASARREDDLADAFREVTLSVETEDDRLTLLQDGPFRCENRCCARSGCDWDPDYEVTWEWEVTVPPDVDLEVSTVNGGSLSVDGARGNVRAANVNGALRLTALGGGEVSATTVNGGVVAQFDRAPATDSTFVTVNGKVELELPRDTRAEVSVDTLHGDLYTDFEAEAIPVKAVAERESGSGHRYRFDQDLVVRIGGGAAAKAVRLDCRTVNGDVVVRAR